MVFKVAINIVASQLPKYEPTGTPNSRAKRFVQKYRSNDFGPKNILDQQKFESKKCWIQKNCWVQKMSTKFYAQKNVTQKIKVKKNSDSKTFL